MSGLLMRQARDGRDGAAGQHSDVQLCRNKRPDLLCAASGRLKCTPSVRHFLGNSRGGPVIDGAQVKMPEGRVAELAEAQKRTEEKVAALAQSQKKIQDILGDLQGRSLKGAYRDKPYACSGPILRRAQVISLRDLETL